MRRWDNSMPLRSADQIGSVSGSNDSAVGRGLQPLLCCMQEECGTGGARVVWPPLKVAVEGAVEDFAGAHAVPAAAERLAGAGQGQGQALGLPLPEVQPRLGPITYAARPRLLPVHAYSHVGHASLQLPGLHHMGCSAMPHHLCS